MPLTLESSGSNPLDALQIDSKHASAKGVQHRMAAVPDSEHEELVPLVLQPSTRVCHIGELASGGGGGSSSPID